MAIANIFLLPLKLEPISFQMEEVRVKKSLLCSTTFCAKHYLNNPFALVDPFNNPEEKKCCSHVWSQWSYFLMNNKPEGHGCLGGETTSILSAWAYAAASVLSSEAAWSSCLSFAHLGFVVCLQNSSTQTILSSASF